VASRKPAARSAPPRPAASRGGRVSARAGAPGLPHLSPARRREVVGSLLVIVGVVTLVMLISPVDAVGAVGAAWLRALHRAFGWGYIAFPWLVGALGAWLVLDAVDGTADVRWSRPIAGAVTFVLALAAVHLLVTVTSPRADLSSDLAVLKQVAVEGRGGGWVGWAFGYGLARNLGAVAGLAALVVALVFSVSVALGHTVRRTLDAIGGWLLAGARFVAPVFLPLSALLPSGVRRRWRARMRSLDAASDEEGLWDADADRFDPLGGGAAMPAAGAVPALRADVEAGIDPAADVDAVRAPIPGETAVDRAGPAPDVAPGPGMARAATKPEWILPRIPDIFDEVVDGGAAMPDDAEAQAHTIEQTLADFGIPVKVVQINRGPRITQFGLEPGVIERKGERIRVKVSRIVALQNDLALALAAAPIRVQAPVPGRPYVGIEVPNKAEDVVSLRSIIESDAFKKVAEKGALPIGLGRDISGKPVAADLAKMPHLLIAGATGAGKSVAINTLICSLLMTHTPETLKLVLVDPKRVELVGYRGLPHLAAPVVVEVERVVGVLQWAVREMERRYKAFAEAGARNIETWNQMEAAAGRATLPYLVIVIDELADLMMVAPEEAERLITRLAQLARATGMHLVLATQRPSVDVVTGLIKANFPARIAFAVSSSIDSRVILDSVGADKLLGRGDMLYMAADSSKLQRIQGCYLSDAEIERLGHHWKYAARPPAAAGEPLPDMSLTLGIPDPLIQPELWDEMLKAGTAAAGGAGDGGESRDELWAEAVALIGQHRTASTSFLQRKLRIGYSRAARLLDDLEAAGHVGPSQGSSGREVHIVAESDAGDGAGAGHDGGSDDDGWRIDPHAS